MTRFPMKCVNDDAHYWEYRCVICGAVRTVYTTVDELRAAIAAVRHAFYEAEPTDIVRSTALRALYRAGERVSE